MQNKYAYDLVIIDSLDGCNDSNPYEENRREYALPIRNLLDEMDKTFLLAQSLSFITTPRKESLEELLQLKMRWMKLGI